MPSPKDVVDPSLIATITTTYKMVNASINPCTARGRCPEGRQRRRCSGSEADQPVDAPQATAQQETVFNTTFTDR